MSIRFRILKLTENNSSENPDTLVNLYIYRIIPLIDDVRKVVFCNRQDHFILAAFEAAPAPFLEVFSSRARSTLLEKTSSTFLG